MEKDQPAAEKQPQPAKAQPKTKPKTQTKKPSASKLKSKALTVRKSAVEKPINLENLIGKAITKGNLDVVERLLAVRKQLKDEFATEQFYIAMSGFQRDCPTILKKNEVVETKGDRKGEVRFRYATAVDIVNALKDLLERWGFSYTFNEEDQPDHVKVTGFAHHKAGWTESNTVSMPIDKDAYMNAPQKVASARMYALRYAFCNAFGILTADPDDAAMSAGDVTTDSGKVTRTVEPEKPDSGEGINSLCDRILSKLRSGAFTEGERDVLEKRCMEIHKQGNVKPLTAFEENIDRQIKFKRRQQKDGSSEGS